MITVLDVATTGLPLWKEPKDDPAQPRIVQLAALHFDGELRLVNRVACIFERDGSVSAGKAAEVHGISEGRRNRYGLNGRGPLAVMCGMVEQSAAVASFGWSFDRFVLEAAMLRTFGGFGRGWIGPLRPSLRTICIKTHAEQRANAGKHLTLADAHRAIVGSDYQDDEDADAGAMAAARILFALVKIGEVKL